MGPSPRAWSVILVVGLAAAGLLVACAHDFVFAYASRLHVLAIWPVSVALGWMFVLGAGQASDPSPRERATRRRSGGGEGPEIIGL
jgi:hypothetical protein